MTATATSPAAPAAWSASERQLAAIMAVSRAVAESGELDETLDHIAEAAADLVEAKAVAIILRASESRPGLALAGQYGLRREFVEYLNEEGSLEVGKGAAGLAAATGETVAVEDVLADERLRPWREVIEREPLRSFVAVPLVLRDGVVIGVLAVYRAETGSWDEQELEVLRAIADHAAIATRTANLLDETRRQVEGLSLLVRSLRAQGHEHSNRLHTIYGLLTLGEVDQARRLIAAVEDQYYTQYAHITARIENPVLAGFLVAEAGIAKHSGIELRVDRRSRLTALPASLSELDAVTLVGNLVHNAVDAVSSMPPRRRRISLRFAERDAVLAISVRDWGEGVAPEISRRMFEPHVSTKEGHSGIGLALVRGIVMRAAGTIRVDDPESGGFQITVELPR